MPDRLPTARARRLHRLLYSEHLAVTLLQPLTDATDDFDQETVFSMDGFDNSSRLLQFSNLTVELGLEDIICNQVLYQPKAVVVKQQPVFFADGPVLPAAVIIVIEDMMHHETDTGFFFWAQTFL